MVSPWQPGGTLRPDLLLLSTPLEARDLPGGVCPSLSNLTLGSFLLSHGATVSVYDPSVELEPGCARTLLPQIAEAVLARRPAMVGIACLSKMEGRFGVAAARAIKARSPHLPVVLGGIWSTACAAEVLESFAAVDAVVAGPGEQAALVLVDHGLDRPEQVPGLVWRRGGTIVSNPRGVMPSAPPPNWLTGSVAMSATGSRHMRSGSRSSASRT